MKYEVVAERSVDKSTGIISDQDIMLTGLKTSQCYPERIRMVVYEDYATNNVYTFITNDFCLPGLTIAELYRERWYVETFFKFIKGRLHIKSFYGTSRNAVYTQIWIVVGDYLLLVISEIFKRNKSNNKTENDGQLSLWPDFSGQ